MAALVVGETWAGEGGSGGLADLMNAQLNALPRMGRRSYNPFAQDNAFRFDARPRRSFWNPLSAMGFRFYNQLDPEADKAAAAERHKRDEGESPAAAADQEAVAAVTAADTQGDSSKDKRLSLMDLAALHRQSKREPGPHPLPRPYATVKADQSFWEDLVGEAARDSIMKMLVSFQLFI